jgi:hypothetical protein
MTRGGVATTAFHRSLTFFNSFNINQTYMSLLFAYFLKLEVVITTCSNTRSASLPMNVSVQFNG